MPELPDVQNFVEYLKSTALHKNIDNVEVISQKILKDISTSKIKAKLKNKSFEEVSRYGKNLFAKTSGDDYLRLHFGMTGNLKYYKGENEDLQHVRFLLHFPDDYKLAYICQRMFGEVSLETGIDDFIDEHNLGPDAMDISSEEMKKIIKHTKKAIKNLLMDQGKIAGIGNVYSDEILFQSGLRPDRSASDLDEEEIQKLYKQTKRVLEYAIKHDADPNKFGKSYLLPKRFKDNECPKCGTPIETIKTGGRTTYFCPQCQK